MFVGIESKGLRIGEISVWAGWQHMARVSPYSHKPLRHTIEGEKIYGRRLSTESAHILFILYYVGKS